MEFQQFANGVGAYALLLVTLAAVAAVAGLIPLAIGYALKQRRLGFIGFLVTAASFMIPGFIIGLLVLLVSSVVVLALSIKRRASSQEGIDVQRTPLP